MVGLSRQHIVETRTVDVFNHELPSRIHRDTAALGFRSWRVAIASAGKPRIYGRRMEITRERSFYLDQPSKRQSLRPRVAPIWVYLRHHGNCSVSSSRAIRCD